MKSLNLYQNRFKEFGVDHKSLLWKTKGAAHQRFRQFWAEIDFDNKKVLDIGCGFGEFGKFLLKRYKNVDYTGIDVMPGFIENARKEVPGGKFFVADFMNDPTSPRLRGASVVIASGVLNSNISAGDARRGAPKPGLPFVGGFGADKRQDPQGNLEYRKKAIQRLFSLTDGILAFNMLGGHPKPKDKKGSNVSYSDSLEILKYCMSLTRRVILRSNYHPKDFTIIMYKVRGPEFISG